MATYRSISDWKRAGLVLARSYRSSCWHAGDWWNTGGLLFGVRDRKAAITTNWPGLSHDTLKVYGHVARRFPKPLRRLNADPSHFQTVAPLTNDVAMPLLAQAVKENWSVNVLRNAVARIRHARPVVGGDIVDDLSDLIARGDKFRAILADVPWEFRATPMGRIGKHHTNDVYYPSMATEKICELPVRKVADRRAFLFLWCPAIMLKAAIGVLEAWGFEYKTNLCWDKDHGFGSGYYFRMRHEHLLLGLGPRAPRHFDDPNIKSVLRVRRTELHSAKPAVVHDIVQRACPGPYLELFGRRRVPGWTVLGNEIAPLDTQHKLAAD